MGITKFDRSILSKYRTQMANKKQSVIVDNPEINKRHLKIKIGTMVKDEDDIITDWITYYGNIFGFSNLHIIDNYSNDHTYKICKQFLSKGITLSRKPDYKKKGLYMTEIMRNTECDIFIPVDIDEFIIYYEHQKDCISVNNIINYLQDLISSRYTFFKMNYINPIKTNNMTGLKTFTHGEVIDYNINAKTFINKHNISKNFIFDHGNHVQVVDYKMTKLYLIHYHQREHSQVLKKIYNNVSGLGNDADDLEKLQKLGNIPGHHRVSQQISILKDKSKNMGPKLRHDIANKFSLKSIVDFINVNT